VAIEEEILSNSNNCRRTKAASIRTSVVAQPTSEFMDFIAKHNIRFEDPAAQRQHDGGDHNRRETPLFAASLERMALGHAHRERRNVGAA
jgi:hypothetical protein